METRTLFGDTPVSKLCMGTVNFGTKITEEQSFRHMDVFCQHGGNFLDTAHVYSNWIPGETNRSERIIGRWLKHNDRSRIVLCTKGGHFDLDAPAVSRVTPEEITRDLHESLEALQSDYIDLYMLHRDNTALPVDEIMDCLDGFVRSGKVKHLACSNWSAQRTAQANAYARRTGKVPFAVNQLMWSMAAINRSAIPADYVTMDEDMLRLGQETGLGFMCYTAMANGYFTRRFAGLPLSDNVRRTYDNPENEQLFQQLLSLPDRAAVTRESLRFFDRQSVAAIPIASFSSEEQLLEAMQAFE